VAGEWEDVPSDEAGWEDVPKEQLPRAAQAQRDFTAWNERNRQRTANFVEGSRQAGEGLVNFGRDVGEKFLERAPAVMTGALAGGTAGATLGPVGAVAGGALGAAGGSAAYDTGKNVARATGLASGPQTPTSQIVANAAEEAKWEAMLGPLGPILGRLKAAVVGRGAGLRPEGVQMAREAEQRGINLGLADVGTGPANEPLQKVFGSFPVVGGPSRHAYNRKVGEVNRAAEGFVENIDTPRPTPEMGVELQQQAQRTYEGVRGQVDDAYGVARQSAEASGATVPTDNIRRAARQFLEEYAASRPRTADGAPIDPVADHPLMRQAQALANLQPTLTTQQYEALTRDFDMLLRQAQREGFQFRNVERVRQGAEADFAAMSDPETLARFQQARQAHSEGMAQFETPTARKFEQVDRNAFGPGYESAGPRNADELMTTAWQVKSPAAMQQLHQLVGPDTFRQALASKLDDALDQSYRMTVVNGREVPVFDAATFRRNLGLTGRTQGQAYQALQTAFNLSGSGTRMADLEKFLQQAEAATGRDVPNVSTFLARRAGMAGMRGVEGATLIGSMAQFGPAAMLPFFAGRRISTMLSDPDYLRDLTRLMDPTTPDAIRTAILPRIRRGQAVAPLLSDTPKQEERPQ
jgi:hypothetical protein